MLHTLRQVVDDDEKWRSILRGMNKDFYHQVVTSRQIEEYFADKTGLALEPFFDQYLRDTRIPVLEYWLRDGKLLYRWANCGENFNMPVDVLIDGKKIRIQPRTSFQVMETVSNVQDIAVEPNYYVYSFNIYGKE